MRINSNVMAALERVERAAADQGTYSRQPRFGEAQATDIMMAFTRWVNSADDNGVPAWGERSRERDGILRELWKNEPHLAGVVSSVTSIDANRQWTLTGGRGQVRRFDAILRDAENGDGWRIYASKASLSFYTTDVGHIAEVGRDGDDGPMRALFHVDSARCELTGDTDTPLRYIPHLTGKAQEWMPADYFRVASMPSDDEQYNDLGFCAISRVLLIAQLLKAVYQHDWEMLSARVPRGLLLLQNIDQNQWRDAMTGNAQTVEGYERQYFNNVAVIAQMGMDAMDAKLVPFSQLPANFDLKIATDLYMYGIALCFGYDPIEFWPVTAGTLGRGRESEIQQRKAMSKGAHAFTLGYQDRIQREMPDSLLFEFEQRDVEGERADADLFMAWAQVAQTLTGGEAALSVDEARTFLAEKGVIPPDWTVGDEDTQTTAEGETRAKDRLLANYHIRRAIEQNPYEPIIQIEWPSNRGRILWNSGIEAMQRDRGYWYDTRPHPAQIAVQRAGDDVLYEDGDEGFAITAQDVADAINEGAERVGAEFGELLTADEAGE